jgi:uncharacterized protein (TIGR02246 family)
MVDPKKQPGPAGTPPSGSGNELEFNSTVDEFFKRLQADMRRPQPSQEAVAGAFQTMQRLAAESSASAVTRPEETSLTITCGTCGHQNRPGNHFCGMCGLSLSFAPESPAQEPPILGQPDPSVPPTQSAGPHHFHHHYHHHYFPQGNELPQFGGGAGVRAAATDTAMRDAKLRPAGSAPMSRAETAVRKVTLDWALACNNKQLDDLVSTYATDAMVLRPNHPAIRGAAAIREYFVGVLDAGLGEVELDPLRVDVIGDVAYEAGRCKMLVPMVVGKRREERGKYMTLLVKQSNGEWRIAADCWSSDLSLTSSAEAEGPRPGSPTTPALKPPLPRKNP